MAKLLSGTRVYGNLLVDTFVTATGNVVSTANVSGNYLLGNVFFATGITASKIYNGNSEVNVGTSGGAANISIGGTSNVAVFSSTGLAITGNLSVSGNATLSGNILGDRVQNGTTSIDIQTASGNANISVSGTSNVVVFSSSGQNVAGYITSTGNITGNYLLGNAFFATGITANKIYNGTTEVAIGSSGGNANISVGGTSNVVVFTTAGLNVTGIVSATGNVTGRYFLGNANVQYTAATAPVTGNLIGAQWYNTATDVLYEYQTDGTSTYWVDITGPIIGSNGAAGGTTLTNGTSNVSVELNGNTNVNIAGTPNVFVVSSGGINTTGAVYSNYNTNTANTASFNATGGNTKGGTGYLDFLVVNNTSGGATNPYKWLRVDNTGKFEIINSAYTSSILNLTDSGNLSIAGQYQVSGKQAINGPAFRAYIAVNQAITSGSQQKVTFGSETFDTNSNFASSRFTPTVEGYYQLNATVRMGGTSGTGEIMITIWKNGSEYARGTNESGTEQGAGWYSMQVSDLAYANGTGDYFEIYIQQTSGSNKDTTAGTNISYFSGAMVRGA